MEITPSLEHQLITGVAKLPKSEQQRVFEFASALASTSGFRGVSGRELRRFAGTISSQDADEMRMAVEEGCKQLDNDQ